MNEKVPFGVVQCRDRILPARYCRYTTAYNPIGASVFSTIVADNRDSLYLIDSPLVKSSPHGEQRKEG